MIAFLAGLSILQSPREAKALAWADRLYREVAPLPINIPAVAPQDALEAYERVQKSSAPRSGRGRASPDA